MILAVSVGLVSAQGGTAVKAGTATFGGNDCTATFVRSASGIINETNRNCISGDHNGYYLQFRPVVGTPNPACDPVGLVLSFPFTNTEASLDPWFVAGKTYNACFYLVPTTGTFETTESNPEAINLPINGNYSVCVSGTYKLQNNDTFLADANFVSVDNWTTATKGFIGQWQELGLNEGNVQINGEFANWGAFTTNHTYCSTFTGQSIALRVFDGYSTTNTIDQGWYGDNSGTLSYVIKYLGN